MHPLRSVLGVLAVCAVALAGCSPGPDVAARVGDVDITHGQVRTRANVFRFLGGLNQQPCGTPVEGESAGAACSRFALGNLVQSELTGGYARDRGIELEPDVVADALAGLDGSLEEGELDRRLEAAGITIEDVEDLATDALLGQEVANAVAEERVGDGALRTEYESRPLEFTRIEVQHILVDTRAEAETAHERVTAPEATEETFADVAREVSTDAGSAQGGGGYPPTLASEFVPEFSQTALSLEPGEISAPMQTQFGWHVIRLVGQEQVPFAEVREQILRELAGPQFEEWFRERARELEIDVNPRYGRFDLQTLRIEAVRSTDPDADAEAEASGDGADAIQPP